MTWISFVLLVRSENWMLSACVIVRPIEERNLAPAVKSSKKGPSKAAIVPRARWAYAIREGRAVLFNLLRARS